MEKECRKMFRKFSEIKGFDSWMIGALVFSKQENAQEVICSVKKRKERTAVLEAAGNGLRVEMHLVKPQEEQNGRIKKTYGFSPEDGTEVISKVFLEKEILAFVQEAGDENPIHRTQTPVVPGLLLAEWLWEEGKVPLEGKKMAFHAPAYAREKITVYREKERPVYVGVSAGRILWKLSSLSGAASW